MAGQASDRRIGPQAVSPVCFGGNVLGWTADPSTSLALLDRFVALGGTFVDTADAYSAWAPGHLGGESERIIGEWLAARGNRSEVVIATKVGKKPDRLGLGAATVRAACEESLGRLGTDYVDLYYCHADDPDVPLAETIGALGELVREGKVRQLGLSNYSPERLLEALQTCDELGVPRFAALQPHYNLMERLLYEGALQRVCAQEGIACLPYFALAAGFLTGKYRTAGAAAGVARENRVSGYFTERGLRVLGALDRVAARHASTPTAVALAWLLAQPTVVSVLASATTIAQLEQIMAPVELDGQDLEELDHASAQ